jgi:rhamnose transport system substrate-binding protein
MIDRRHLILGSGALALAACSKPADKAAPGAAGAALRIGVVAKALGNPFFNAVEKGANQAAAEIGGVTINFTAPQASTAEGQIEVLRSLIAQKVDAIAISATDPDALVPTLKSAMQRGIKVISYDSGVAKDGRLVHLAPASDDLVGQTCIEMAADAAGGAGEVAILSATATATNQNIWIEAMKKALAGQPNLKLVATVYGDDQNEKSYREAQALLKQHPNLKVIIAPTSVGIVGAAKAVQDQGLTGKVFVTGLGLPSEMRGYVKSGVSKSFALWNPIDLGYAAVQLAVAAAKGTSVGPNTTVPAGRVGQIAFNGEGVGDMGKPFVFNAGNIDGPEAGY